MTQYKLVYFDARGLAEPIRWIFSLAKVPYDDVRINIKDWATERRNPLYPLGCLPVLFDHGRTMTQSHSIVRYLCRNFHFVAQDPYLNYRSEEVADIVEEIRIPLRELLREKARQWVYDLHDPQTEREVRHNMLNNVLPKHLKRICNIVEETEGDFIAGSQITSGDFILASWLQIYEDFLDTQVLKGFPAVKKTQQAVVSLEGIKEWIRIRPLNPV